MAPLVWFSELHRRCPNEQARRHSSTGFKYVQDHILLCRRNLFGAYFGAWKTRRPNALSLWSSRGSKEKDHCAGLTHGGFYSYFRSKSDLYAAVLGCFFTDPEWKNCWEGVQVDLSSTGVGPQVVRAYLSRQHFEDVENSCPMVALPTDVARSGKSARLAFETVFKAMVSVLERSLIRNGKRRRSTAQSIAALAIGGMVVARTLDDRRLADQLRADCMSVALDLGGWDKKSKSGRGKLN